MDRVIEKKKWPPKKIAGVSVLAVLVIAIIYNIGFGDHSSKLNVETQKITISTVQEGPFQEFIPVTGTVLPITTIYLDAIEGGKVDTVFRKAGSYVNKGDLILRLENTMLHIQISQQDAQTVEQRNLLTNTRFNLDQNRTQSRQLLIDREYQTRRLKRIYERQKRLYEENLISQEEFEQSKDDYEFEARRQRLNIQAFKRDSIFQEVQLKQLEASKTSALEQNLVDDILSEFGCA